MRRSNDLTLSPLIRPNASFHFTFHIIDMVMISLRKKRVEKVSYSSVFLAVDRLILGDIIVKTMWHGTQNDHCLANCTYCMLVP